MTMIETEFSEGRRFKFGKNWARFLAHMNDERIKQAESSLRQMLGIDNLKGKTFLDAGSGSGLFSLAARRLGATVHSFDYDPQSVACTNSLRSRYCPHDPQWIVEEASVLDNSYLQHLGTFDIVYSWGVLHHTGAMWQALHNVAALVNKKGYLFIAIYNDQGGWSRRWLKIKRVYNKLPSHLRVVFSVGVIGPRELKFFLLSCLRGRPDIYFRKIARYSEESLRGMSYWHDLIDWVGGYPFEVASPEEIFDFYRNLGFELKKLRTCKGGIACNEFVFEKNLDL
jgi:2-polyprenyl-6-hydroxyphenyl methylase/3-demethylubiquinone-9 3-methyltransferase